jgi:hypothetical protein
MVNICVGLCLDCVAVAPSVLLLPLNSGLSFRVRATRQRRFNKLVNVTLTFYTRSEELFHQFQLPRERGILLQAMDQLQRPMHTLLRKCQNPRSSTLQLQGSARAYR